MQVSTNNEYNMGAEKTNRNTRDMADCSLVKENKKTIWVRLNDGNVIKRHKNKQKIIR